MEIVPVPAFADNYLWLVRDGQRRYGGGRSRRRRPVLAEADRRGWPINQVRNTHWHPDHTGGNLAVKEDRRADLGSGERTIPDLTFR